MGEIKDTFISKSELGPENPELKYILGLKNSGSNIASELWDIKDKLVSTREHASDSSARIEKAKEIDQISTDELLKTLKKMEKSDLEKDPIFYNTVVDRLFFRALNQVTPEKNEAES